MTVIFFRLFYSIYPRKENVMYVMIDNYDSFVHNLAVYLEELGQKVSLIRNDNVDILSLKRLCLQGELDGIWNRWPVWCRFWESASDIRSSAMPGKLKS